MASDRLEERISTLTDESISAHLKAASKKWSKTDFEIEGQLLRHFLQRPDLADQRPLAVALSGAPSFLGP